MVSESPKVLIVDDEEVVCELLNEELSERDYRCVTALEGNTALSQLDRDDFDVVLLDIRLPGMSGMEVLREIWLNHSQAAVIMITAVNDVSTAVEAMKLGAADYIVKPFDLDRVDASVKAALETKRTAGKSSTQMDAIATGVETKLDPFSAYSKVVTQRTIDIARQLGIANKEIQGWVETKSKLDTEKDNIIKSEHGALG